MRFNSILSALLLVASVIPSPARAITLTELDAIVSKAPDAAAFVAPENHAIQDEYFAGLQQYYGPGKIKREQYDAVLSQLRDQIKENPELGARLWETSGLGKEFSLTLAVKSTGVDLKDNEWKQYWPDYLGKLKARASSILSIASPEEQKTQVKKILDRANTEIENFEAKASQLDKKTKGLEQAKFYRDTLPHLPGLDAASAYVAYEKFQESSVRETLDTRNADLILDQMDRLRSNAKVEFTLPDLPVPEKLRSILAAKTVPKLELPPLSIKDGKPSESALFRTRTVQTNRGKIIYEWSGTASYYFEPIPRRIHGIFKGIPLGECVGGLSCERLTPERWATVALKNTQFYSIERRIEGAPDSTYLGFIQVVPVQSKNGKIYGSVDFGAPTLNNSATVKMPNGSRINATLYEFWVHKYSRLYPRAWSGLVVSEGKQVNNAGVKNTVFNSDTYSKGLRLGPSVEFSHIDPLANKIVESNPKKLNAYGGRMIFDAFANGSGALTRLSSLSVPRILSILNNPSVLNNPSRLRSYQQLLEKNGQPIPKAILRKYCGGISNPESKSFVAQLLAPDLNSPDSKIREETLKSLVTLGGPTTDRLLALAVKNGNTEAADALSKIKPKDPETLKILVEGLANKSSRPAAALALKTLSSQEPSVIAALADGMGDSDGLTRARCVLGLLSSHSNDPTAVAGILTAVQDKSMAFDFPGIQKSAAEFIGTLKTSDERSLSRLIDALPVISSSGVASEALLKNIQSLTQANSLQLVQALGDNPKAAAILTAQKTRDPIVLRTLAEKVISGNMEAAHVFAELKPEDSAALRSAAEALGTETGKRASARALSTLSSRDPAVVTALAAHIKDPDRSVRVYALDGLLSSGSDDSTAIRGIIQGLMDPDLRHASSQTYNRASERVSKLKTRDPAVVSQLADALTNSSSRSDAQAALKNTLELLPASDPHRQHLEDVLNESRYRPLSICIVDALKEKLGQ